MSARYWLPVLAFCVVSIPLVMLLNALDVAGEFRVWIALAAGVVAAGLAQQRLRSPKNEE